MWGTRKLPSRAVLAIGGGPEFIPFCSPSPNVLAAITIMRAPRAGLRVSAHVTLLIMLPAASGLFAVGGCCITVTAGPCASADLDKSKMAAKMSVCGYLIMILSKILALRTFSPALLLRLHRTPNHHKSIQRIEPEWRTKRDRERCHNPPRQHG